MRVIFKKAGSARAKIKKRLTLYCFFKNKEHFYSIGRAWLAQLVRSLPSNHKVPGSIFGYAKN